MPLLHCPGCCPKKWETVHNVAGSTQHDWEPEHWDEDGNAVGPWGWKCTNCGHFKKPRKKRTRVTNEPTQV